eukprot:TRINITY_DN11559_c0_g1_i1.p1 TRINITY_DN11559_c0_g1~~TRINITY_DN11559_c0_g1_i1.p1  ORF type:complete len:490 (-),score=73.45 TRINITY_DN11559_c0_g1_i1:74-1543(-)
MVSSAAKTYDVPICKFLSIDFDFVDDGSIHGGHVQNLYCACLCIHHDSSMLSRNHLFFRWAIDNEMVSLDFTPTFATMAGNHMKCWLERSPEAHPGISPAFYLHEGVNDIGRVSAGNHFIVDSPTKEKMVSRKHARIVVDTKAGTVEILDMTSMNGTIVNKIKIDRKELTDGDVICFGGAGNHKVGTAFEGPMATDVIYIFRNADKSDNTPPASPSATTSGSWVSSPSTAPPKTAIMTKREDNSTGLKPASPSKSVDTPVSATKKRSLAGTQASPEAKRIKIIEDADTPAQPATKTRAPQSPATPSGQPKKQTKSPTSESRTRAKSKKDDHNNDAVEPDESEIVNVSWPTLALGRSPTITEYDSVTVNGRVFKIGDVVSLFPPGDDKKNYFMGKIVRICRTHKEDGIVRIQWFYRPADAPEVSPKPGKREVFASAHEDDNPVEAINWNLTVVVSKRLDIKDLQEYESKPHHYWYSRFYNYRTEAFSKIL